MIKQEWFPDKHFRIQCEKENQKSRKVISLKTIKFRVFSGILPMSLLQ